VYPCITILHMDTLLWIGPLFVNLFSLPLSQHLFPSENKLCGAKSVNPRGEFILCRSLSDSHLVNTWIQFHGEGWSSNLQRFPGIASRRPHTPWEMAPCHFPWDSGAHVMPLTGSCPLAGSHSPSLSPPRYTAEDRHQSKKSRRLYLAEPVSRCPDVLVRHAELQSSDLATNDVLGQDKNISPMPVKQRGDDGSSLRKLRRGTPVLLIPEVGHVVVGQVLLMCV
jgi:rRNA maturation protein Nop10